MTLGLPGTGLFWTERIPPHKPAHAGHRLLFMVVVALVALYLIGKFAGG